MGTYHNHILCQNVNTVETSTVYRETLLRDELTIERIDIANLYNRKKELVNGALPVGSVEFVKQAMKIADIRYPKPISYPPELNKYLKRKIVLSNIKHLRGNLSISKNDGLLLPKFFIKPYETKKFTGFVFNGNDANQENLLNEYENFVTGSIGPIYTKIWVSEVVNFVYEYRFYIMNNKIIGYARYDDHEDEFVEKEQEVINTVNQAIKDYGRHTPYCIDMGILDNGEISLVECNDAWAIGLYGRCLSSDVYYNFLRTRWDSIILG